MNNNLKQNNEYKKWLTDIKKRIKQTQIKAAIKVNTELLRLYWDLGEEIVEKQLKSQWGDTVIRQLSSDLREEFPNVQGFSERNLLYAKQLYSFYNQEDKILQQVVAVLPKKQIPITQQVVAQLPDKQTSIVQQVAGQLENHPIFQIPWGHNLLIITKCQSIKEALFYVQKTIQNGWSRSMLTHHLELNLYEREGKAVTNFASTLPAPQSDLAMQTLKDPYIFDLMTLTEKYNERELEDALTENITKFLLELGAGFAYVGRQVPLNIDGTDYPVDLLFYHLKLRCFVVIELKTVKFVPETAGKTSFYLSAIDDLMRHPTDNPTIGLIICKNKNNLVAEYALRGINQPIGISEYQLTKVFPEQFKGSLPSIEEIEEELNSMKKNKN
ncbi:MAG: PDDEXK nuclease domain-containing protein [Dysgonamonadaceae bacterium]|jgi:predicted nuclease of restriction endonuclease-like (RecB) superfamily|nr:PDDEXK nuclease domain-containing protein [Dysgonamonadaceae bacterium]